MRQLFSFLLLMVSAGPTPLALAQPSPSITRADLPAPGDTLRLSQAAPLLPAGGPVLSQKGANQTWNFAALTPQSQRVERYTDLSQRPALQQFAFGPFGGVNRANLASPQTLPLPAGAALPISDPVAFFNLSNTELRSVGFGATVGGVGLPVTYRSAAEQDVIYRLPLSFASLADSSNSYFEVNLPGTGFLSQRRKRLNKVDAWGTLTTPFGTFQTVRVVSRLLDHDSLSTGGLPGQGLTLPPRREYKWLAPGGHVPVLTIITNELAGQETVFSIEYRDQYRRLRQATAARDAATEAALLAYPIPLPAGADLHLRGLAGRGPLTLTATDLLGRSLFRQQVSGRAPEVLTVPAAAFGGFRGVGLLTITTAQGVAVRRLVRE